MNRTINRQALLRELRELHPTTFEQLIADLYRAVGHGAELTESTSDRGRDAVVYPRMRPGRTVVQVKRYGAKTTVDSGHVQKYSGVYAEPGYVYDVTIVTTGPVTKDAREVADRRGVGIVDEDSIAAWVLDRDPQLTVLADYVDVDAVVEEGWEPVDRPSLRAPALLCGGLLALLVGVGVAGWPLLNGVPSPTVVWGSIPYALGGLLTTAGLSVALSEFRDSSWPLLALVMLLSVGHIGGLASGVVWWSELVGDAFAGTRHVVPDYALSVPGVGSPLAVPSVAVQAGTVLSALVAVAVAAAVVWLRRRRSYRFSVRSDENEGADG